jgi:penicillin amidase
MNWHDLDLALEELAPDTRAIVERYTEGVNAALARKSPWEFRLVGHRPGPWRPEDSILLARMTGYLTLAQSQGEIERFIVELVQAGVERERLEDLFPGRLEGLDVELLREVRLGERMVPDKVRWEVAGLRMMASNNWVVAGSRTKSGAPILCNDPHLEINRLPNVFAEQVLRTKDRWFIGSSMPGMPAMLIGRTQDLAWGVTYAFMDATDSWVEDCRDGKYRRGDEWVDFAVREETIERKKHPAEKVRFFENDHGVLDGDPHEAGLYLSTRWTGDRTDGVSLEAFADLFRAESVDAGMQSLGRMQAAFNWVFADRGGGIGYQMSGLMPRRREGVSGIVPLSGWDPENDWQGWVDPAELPRERDPERGYIVTANQDLNHLSPHDPINVCMADYRARRIADLIEASESLTVQDMERIQYDLYSLQAERFLELLEPLLPDTHNANLLREWDRRYDLGSRGATLFERFYDELLREVFGRALGREVFEHVRQETGLFVDFYDAFDRMIMRGESAWFDGRSRDELLSAALERALEGNVEPWAAQRRVVLTNLFFGGKLPDLFGFDRGPIRLPGGRATVCQGQIYRSAGRLTSFAPAVRIIAPMAETSLYTNIAGGPSDRRFSPWYSNDLRRWLTGEYKKLEA